MKFAVSEDYFVHNLVLIFNEILPASPWFTYGTGVVLRVVGGVVGWRRGLVGRMVVPFPLLFFLGVSASQLPKSAWPFYFLRYVLPAQVFVVPTLAVGAVTLLDWAWMRRRLAFAPAYAIGPGAVIVGSLARLPSALLDRAHLFAWSCKNIEELNVAMAVGLRDNVPAGESIVVNDAGASRCSASTRFSIPPGSTTTGGCTASPAPGPSRPRRATGRSFPRSFRT